MTSFKRPSRRIAVATLLFLAILAWHAETIAAQLAASWVDNAADAVGLSVERSMGSTGTFTEINATGPAVTTYGTVTLTQSVTSVLFDVVLNSGNRFVETGAGGGELFLFNDSLSGSTITNIPATLNGATVTIPGGLSGFTNLSPVMADGTGTFTASVECTDPSNDSREID